LVSLLQRITVDYKQYSGSKLIKKYKEILLSKLYSTQSNSY